MRQMHRVITIVTSDWKGSTSLGEQLDAESLREVQTRYFDEMRTVFESHGGTIEKIIGDAIVVVFGLPVLHEDDALRAVAAAAESLRTLASLNDQFAQVYGIRLLVRTGIATGEVVLEEEGSGQHVLSGAVSVTATAMEQSAPPDEVLLAPSTYRQIRDLVKVEALPAITPKGAPQPVTPYRLLAISADAERAVREAEKSDAETAGKLCASCGADNPADLVTCGSCGASLARVVAAQERRKTVTIVFANPRPVVADASSERRGAVREVVTRYFAVMRPILEKHGGTVEKFIGDAVMAVFGLPVLHEDDALRASRAALEMQAALPALNVELGSAWNVTVEHQIGVNTGEVIAGDASLGQRLVTGDAVNVAARLEQAASAEEVLIGELTHRLVRDAVTVEPVEPLQLKGKAEHVPAYRLLSVSRAVEGFRRRQDAPMVGREGEMAALSEIFQRCRNERAGRMATVIADAGTGKSRLIREFVDACDTTSLVLRGRCLPYGEGITFWPLVEAARAAAGIEPADTPDQGVAKLRAFIHDTAVADRIAAAIGLTTEQFGVQEIFWATRKMLEQLAVDRTAIWVIDDIHWAEQTLLDLIVYLLEQTPAPVLLLCSSRHDILETHSDWALRSDSVRLVLQPLSDTDAAQVVQNLLGKAGIAGQVQNRIVQAAEGNPLYVEQMLSMLIDSGSLQSIEGRWEPAVDLADIVVPPTIQALLASRLDLLAPDERAVIEPASVIGLEFAEAAVKELAPREIQKVVTAHLQAMARKQLVRPGSTNVDDASFRFMHILIKDAAYSGLLKRTRAVFHERFAQWADRINRERGRSQEYEEILGYHLEQAYLFLGELGPRNAHGVDVGVRASTLLASAGRRALARGDAPAAVNLLRRSAASRGEADVERLPILLDLAEAMRELGAFDEALAVVREVLDAAKTLGQEVLVRKARLVQLYLQIYAGQTDGTGDWTSTARREVEEAIPVFERVNDEDGLARAWNVEAVRAGNAARWAEMADALENVMRHVRRSGRAAASRSPSATAIALLYGPTPVSEAIARCTALAEHTTSDQIALSVINDQLAQLHAMRGDFDQARTLYKRGRATLEDLGARILAASNSIDAARVELLAADYPAAVRELRRGYDELNAAGEKYLLSTVGGLLARALALEGSFEESEALTRVMEELAAADDVDAQAMWRGVRGRVVAQRGEVSEGRQFAIEAVALRRQSDALALLAEALTDLAEVERLGGDHRAAHAALAEAVALLKRKGDLVSANRLSVLLLQPT